MCHGFVRFAIRRDREGRFRYAPLRGTTFAAAVPAATRDALPDSIVLRAADGRLLVRSEAVLHVLRRLGGGWGRTAAAAAIVPRPLRDLIYDGVARVRHALFARPAEVCPIVPAPLRDRFDP